MATAIVGFSCWFELGDEILSEFGAALVDGDGVPDYFCCTSCRVGEFGSFHEGVFEAWDTVYGVEETEETDTGLVRPVSWKLRHNCTYR